METKANPLGDFLRGRRERLDPATFGFPTARRRTPGLRREEIAQLAHVSATWYTWLEQGRGGAPSADVLDRLARAFELTDVEREHLFLLAQERPPKVRPANRADVSGQLQRVLDAFADTPAIIKTAEWTVVAWNEAAAAVLADYEKLPERDRNVLRMLFRRPSPGHLRNREAVARAVMATVRRDIARAGMRAETAALVEELSAGSEEFRTMWAEHDVGAHGEGSKTILHPQVGPLDLEFSTFALDGRPDLGLVVFNPASDADREKVRQLMAARAAAGPSVE